MDRSDTLSPDATALHQAALEALSTADQALAYAPDVLIAEPHRLCDVTTDWLQRTLGASVPDAKLDALIEVDAHDGMTSRQSWRLSWNSVPGAAQLPTALFVKATPAKDYHRESISVLHLHEAEAKFYDILHPENPGLAPNVFYCRFYPGGRFLIVLEDLTARGCRPYWQADNCSVEHARAVARTQARFHAKYWESPRLLGDLAWVRPRTRRFGWPWLKASFNEVRIGFAARGNEEELPAEAVALLHTWNDMAEAVYAYWETKPHTVLHGDSHLGNTFSYPDGSAGYFDWQVMFAGHGLRDLAYFLMSALTNGDRIAHERDIFDLYLDELACGGVRLDRDTAWDDYCLFVLDRWDAVIKEVMKGGYGHARSAQLRSLETITGALLDNDMAGRLARVRRKMRA